MRTRIAAILLGLVLVATACGGKDRQLLLEETSTSAGATTPATDPTASAPGPTAASPTTVTPETVAPPETTEPEYVLAGGETLPLIGGGDPANPAVPSDDAQQAVVTSVRSWADVVQRMTDEAPWYESCNDARIGVNLDDARQFAVVQDDLSRQGFNLFFIVAVNTTVSDEEARQKLREDGYDVPDSTPVRRLDAIRNTRRTHVGGENRCQAFADARAQVFLSLAVPVFSPDDPTKVVGMDQDRGDAFHCGNPWDLLPPEEPPVTPPSTRPPVTPPSTNPPTTMPPSTTVPPTTVPPCPSGKCTPPTTLPPSPETTTAPTTATTVAGSPTTVSAGHGATNTSVPPTTVAPAPAPPTTAAPVGTAPPPPAEG